MIGTHTHTHGCVCVCVCLSVCVSLTGAAVFARSAGRMFVQSKLQSHLAHFGVCSHQLHPRHHHPKASPPQNITGRITTDKLKPLHHNRVPTNSRNRFVMRPWNKHSMGCSRRELFTQNVKPTWPCNRSFKNRCSSLSVWQPKKLCTILPRPVTQTSTPQTSQEGAF